MNIDSQSAAPVGLSSPFPATWTSNTYDALGIFSFPSDSQFYYIATLADQHSKLSFNQSLSYSTIESRRVFQIQHILQYYLSVKNAFVWSKLTNEGVKVHLTHTNLITCPIARQNRWRFYGSYSATGQLSNSSFKIGALWSNPLSNNFAEVRLRLNQTQVSNEQYLYWKGAYSWKGVNVGGLLAFDWKRLYLQKNDVKLGWEIDNKNWLSLQLQTEGFRNYPINYRRLDSYFDILRANYIYSFNNAWKAGLTVESSLVNKQIRRIEAAVDYSSPISALANLKVKVSSNLELAVAATYSHSPRLKGSFGLVLNKESLYSFKPASFGAGLTVGEQ